ncbi:tetratricopeptide repeat protein [Palleronia aestuarii]|uniref:Tetratricopeptide repeat protein n=1 Tax=Palleronia aestuarii TaxID=568105 RepID=A0A2W7NSF7_9RHOB|nr:tetratricopeptide repeat protein [Palleronia aestuarii]PZX14192.1 tetratricopeptide repeat protein [Palleronia aestuarii]
MSRAPDVAEKSAEICFAAMTFATAAAAGIAPFVVPLAVLATIALQWRNGKRAACANAARDNALAALSASRDFSDADLARAAVLLEDLSRTIRLEPAAMIAAARPGGAATFETDLAHHLMRGLKFDGGEEAVHRAIEIAFVTAIGTCRRHPDIDRDLTQTFLIESARDQSVMLARLEAMNAKVDEILHRLRQSGALQQAEVAGITGFAIQALAKRITPEVADTEQALRELEHAVEIAVRVREEGRHGSNLGDFVDEVLRRSADLAGEGDYDAADDEIEKALRHEAEKSKARKLRLLERGVDTALLRRDAETAAQRIARQEELELPEGADLCSALFSICCTWYEREQNKGVNLDLEVAIQLAKIARQAAVGPDQSGSCLNLRGVALATLGKRESVTARLEEAALTFQAALKEFTRSRAPLEWAGTQNNLGNVLQILGERESGTARLEEAVLAHRAALEEQTRDRVPLDWAMTQMNLGNALQALGKRESGTARLEEAVLAHRAALEERTRERVPLDWAMTQNNLGRSLAALGARESGTGHLEEAVSAYRAALEEQTRERVPLEWAIAQMNLGNVLTALGARESGTARLEEAVSACQAALEERTRDRMPLQWAATQMSLGNALATLGERESGTARLEEAVSAYQSALEERTRDRVPLDWADTQTNLGAALRSLGERESGTTQLEESVVAYRAALEEQTRDRVPLAWATTQNNLGNVLQTLGARESGTTRLEEAVSAFQAALEERTRDRVPLDWAMTQMNLGNALVILGAREIGTTRLEEAVSAYQSALEELTRDRVPLQWEKTQANLKIALDLIADRNACSELPGW